MRNQKAIQNGWQSFLRILANDAKLKFVIGANVGPATNGKCIWLPELPVELNADDLVLFKGNAFHEVGHIRHSDIAYFQAFAAKHGNFGKFLLNALDDVFMEGRMADWKQMASRYLRESTMLLVKRGCYRDGSASLAEAVGVYCLSYLTAKRWPELGTVTATVEANLRKHLAPHADNVMPQLVALLDAEFPSVRSTAHGGDLALKIIELLKQLSEQDQEQGQSQSKDGDKGDAGDQESEKSESESNDEGEGEEEEGNEGGNSDEKAEGEEGDEDGEGESQAGDDADSTDGEGSKGSEGDDGEEGGNGEGQANDEAGSSDESEGNGSNAGQGEEEGNGESQAGNQANGASGKSLKSMIEEMLNESLGDQEIFDKAKAVEELSKQIREGKTEDYKGQPMVDQLEIDGVPLAGAAKDFVDGMSVVEGDKQMAETIKAVIGRKTNVMANRLRALLVNREETEAYSARNGRLSEKSLYRFGLDDTRLFEQSEEREEPTAAVSITADLSGSTLRGSNGTSIAEQIRFALTLLENVLHEIGTPREIFGFAPATEQLNCLVRSFGDNHRVALDRIAGLHRLVGGSHTPIGAAVLQAGTRLMAHESQRKLMFVVTDGSPSDESTAVEMTNFVARNGVEVIYLVIGPSQCCAWLAKNKFKYVNASTAEELIPALVSKVAEFMA